MKNISMIINKDKQNTGGNVYQGEGQLSWGLCDGKSLEPLRNRINYTGKGNNLIYRLDQVVLFF